LGGEFERLGDQLDVLPVGGWRDRLHRCRNEFGVRPVEPRAELKGAELRVGDQVLGKPRRGEAAGNRGLQPPGAVIPPSRPVGASRPVGNNLSRNRVICSCVAVLVIGIAISWVQAVLGISSMTLPAARWLSGLVLPPGPVCRVGCGPGGCLKG
jgi:hypothetical protein